MYEILLYLTYAYIQAILISRTDNGSGATFTITFLLAPFATVASIVGLFVISTKFLCNYKIKK